MSEEPNAETAAAAATQTFLKRAALEEFLIDLLGGLVPGVAFVLGVATSLLLPSYALVHATHHYLVQPTGSEFSAAAAIQAVFKLSGAISTPFAVGAMIFGVLVSYATGILFYRLDPSRPDVRSFSYMARRVDANLLRAAAHRRWSGYSSSRWGRLLLAINETLGFRILNPRVGIFSRLKNRVRELGCMRTEDCEYPYTHLFKYLRYRRLFHLIPFACLPKGSSRLPRSKSFVAALKVRLRFHFPERYGSLIRIESHIRLSSSLWYVSRYLLLCSAFGGAMTAAAAGFAATSSVKPYAWLSYVVAAFAPLAIFVIAVTCRLAVERSLHHQRVRELLYIYETAYTAFRGQYELLSPPFQVELGTTFPAADA